MNFVWRQRVSVARKSYMHGIFLAFLLHLWSFLGDEVVLQRVLVSTNQETARCSPPANFGRPCWGSMAQRHVGFSSVCREARPA